MATSVKTAISIQKELFCEVNRLAKELQISRSKLFVLAVSDFIKKNDDKFEQAIQSFQETSDKLQQKRV